MSRRVRADLALLFCSLVWGGTFIVVKDALADVSIFTYIAVRFALAAVGDGDSVLASAARVEPAHDMGGRANWVLYVWRLCVSNYWTEIHDGIEGRIHYRIERRTGARFSCGVWPAAHQLWIWLGAFSALAGLYFLMIPPEGFGSLNRGDAIALGCAVMFALHVIFIGQYVERHSVGALSFLQVATTAVLATLAVPLLSAAGWETPRLVWSGQLIFAVLITAIGSTVIGFSFQTWAQQYTTPTHTAIFISLEPVFAVITAWIVAHERLGGRVLFGAALILLGIVLAELKGAAPIAPESPEPIVAPGQFE